MYSQASSSTPHASHPELHSPTGANTHRSTLGMTKPDQLTQTTSNTLTHGSNPMPTMLSTGNLSLDLKGIAPEPPRPQLTQSMSSDTIAPFPKLVSADPMLGARTQNQQVSVMYVCVWV